MREKRGERYWGRRALNAETRRILNPVYSPIATKESILIMPATEAASASIVRWPVEEPQPTVANRLKAN